MNLPTSEVEIEILLIIMKLPNLHLTTSDIGIMHSYKINKPVAANHVIPTLHAKIPADVTKFFSLLKHIYGVFSYIAVFSWN